MNRRTFLGQLGVVAGGALAGSTLPIPLPAARPGGSPFRGPAPAPPIRREFREIRRGVGIYSERGGTIGWLMNGDGVLVVDSQFPDTAANCLAGIRERTAVRIDALVNTHHHGDHTGGNGVFRPAVGRIVAHQRARELQRATAEASGNPLDDGALPDVTFQEAWSVELGDEVVHLRHHGPAHTGGDAVVTFEAANVAHMGDLLFNRLHPFIDRPSGASIAGWIDLLEHTLAAHDADTVYIFGHGHPEHGVVGGADDLRRKRDYLAALLETAGALRARGGTVAELEAMTELPGFEEYRSPSERLSLGFALSVAWEELGG